MPRSRYWLTRSTSTIAFVTTMPTSISTPIERRDAERNAGDDLQRDRAGRRERNRHEQQQRLQQRAERRHHHDVDDQDRGEQRESELRERLGLVGGDAAERRPSCRRAGRRRRPLTTTAALAVPRSSPEGVAVTVALRRPCTVVTEAGPSTSATVARVSSRTDAGRRRHLEGRRASRSWSAGSRSAR